MSLSLAGRSEKELIDFIEDRERTIKMYYDTYNTVNYHNNKCAESLNMILFGTTRIFYDTIETLKLSIGSYTIEILDAKEELSKRMNSEFCA